MDSSQTYVSVPAQWVDFFTAKLLSPADFDWARSILQSKLWEIFQHGCSAGSLRQFVLPTTCPTSTPPLCFLQAASQQVSRGFSTPQAAKIAPVVQIELLSTSLVHARKKNAKTPMVISEVRQSDRLKLLHKGYKGKTCFDKNFLACSAVEPPLNKKIVKNLYDKFGLAEDQPLPKKAKKATKKNVDDPKNAQPKKK